MMNEKSIKKVPQINKQLLQIENDYITMTIELEEKLQKYSLPGLKHPEFLKEERKMIENYQKLTTYKF